MWRRKLASGVQTSARKSHEKVSFPVAFWFKKTVFLIIFFKLFLRNIFFKEELVAIYQAKRKSKENYRRKNGVVYPERVR